MGTAEVQMQMAPSPEHRKVKLLLVDDNAENLLALEAILESLGQELVKANSGLEALRHLLEQDFAAILLDVRMPDMDGFETATLIRSRKRSRNTPILFLTGYKNEEHLFRGYDLGAVDFLFKPIVPEILQSKVSVFVELSRNAALLQEQTEELQRAEKRLRGVLEAAPEAMIISGRQDRIQMVNSETERLFGRPRIDLIGQPVSILTPDWPLAPGTQEVTAVTLEGNMFPAEVSLKPLATDEGGIVISVFRDITERKRAQENAQRLTLELERKVAERTRELMVDIGERRRAEQALRESEQSLLVAMEAAQLGLWSVDVREARMRISERTREILGLARNTPEIGVGDWTALVHPEDRAVVSADLERCCDSGAEYESEYRILQADGSARWVLAKGQCLPDQEGLPFRIVGVTQDITQRKLAEQAELHRQKLESMGVLAGGIAHDFNNLLTGILGNASLLLNDARHGTSEQKMLRNLVAAAERAAQLTHQMLAYSGKGRFVIGPVSLAIQIREITALIRASIPKHVTLELDLEDATPPIEADESQIQQLIMNLVINAAEAVNSDSGFVKVRTRVELLDGSKADFYPAEQLAAGAYVVLEVQDNGHGMDAATKSRIFDPFFTTKFTGRGLGLAAALGIVRGHNGGIQVESSLGHGTVFRVYFPVSTHAVIHTAEPPALPNLTGHGTVLVVDDEPVVRDLVKASLERLGYKVLPAADGAEAIEIVRHRSGEITLVLLDMAMPGMTGDEVLKVLRRMRDDLRVVASSGYSEADALKRFGKGIAGFLQKPYNVMQLAAKVREVTAQVEVAAG